MRSSSRETKLLVRDADSISTQLSSARAGDKKRLATKHYIRTEQTPTSRGGLLVSHQLKAHEFLHIQEHIRSEAAVAHKLQTLAQQCRDPQLRSFVEDHARLAQDNVQKLMGLLQ